MNILVSSKVSSLISIRISRILRSLICVILCPVLCVALTRDSQADYYLSQYETIRISKPLLENRTLTICVLVREPFVIYKEPVGLTSESAKSEAQKQLNNYSGIVIEIVRSLADIYSFHIKIVRPNDNHFGVYSIDSGWTGMLGMLVRNESDIGATALSITEKRAEVVDFTRAYYVETGAILLRIPAEVQNFLAVLEPFSMPTWLVLSATILVLIFLVTIMTKLEQNQGKHEKIHKLSLLFKRFSQDLESSHFRRIPSERKFSRQIYHTLELIDKDSQHYVFGSTWLKKFYYATACVINILLIRDIKHPPRQTPIRILVCVWWLSTIVIVNIYLGILFGQLVVPRRPRTIETIEELVNQHQIEWCVTRGSALYELLKGSSEQTVYGQLGLRMRNVSTADEGVQRVIDSGWAFIRERSILTFKVAQEHNRLGACKMQLAREEFYSVGFGLATIKGSRYLKAFNAALTIMIENGFVSRWQAMYWPTRNQFTECGKPQPLREGEPLSVKHFTSVYLICSLIVCLSVCILVYQRLEEQVSSKILERRKHFMGLNLLRVLIPSLSQTSADVAS